MESNASGKVIPFVRPGKRVSALSSRAQTIILGERAARESHPEFWSHPDAQIGQLAETLRLALELHLKGDRNDRVCITKFLTWVILDMQDYKLFRKMEVNHGK